MIDTSIMQDAMGKNSRTKNDIANRMVQINNMTIKPVRNAIEITADAIISNLKNSVTDMDSAPKLLVGNQKNETHLCVVLSSDRGLCGGFNTNICRKAKVFFEKILNSFEQRARETIKY